MSRTNKKIRVLSGIRASGSLHLGNLLGAIKGMKKLQNDPKYETYYMVADLHGITTPFKSSEMKKNRLEIAMDYLAAGIDPEKSTLFLQADVHQHAELAFYLSSAVSVNRLKHLPSYKDKIKKYPKNQTVALFNYPVLMAADILLYKAEKVPIGGDQIYHLEVAREIARKMNNEYNLNFPEPAIYSPTEKNLVVPDILDGKKKMSKDTPEGAIFLNDNLETIKRKIARIPTATAGGKKFPKEGGIYALYILTKLLFSRSRAEQFKNDFLQGVIRYSQLKDEISNAIYNELEPIQKERKKLERNPEKVEEILKQGAKKAEKIANTTLKEVKEKMGLS